MIKEIFKIALGVILAMAIINFLPAQVKAYVK